MAKKIKKYKVGLDSETMAISLVSEPAIEVDFIHMNKDEEEKEQVFLESNEKYLVYGPALIPDKDIYRNNGENEYYLSFSKESIEKMENDYMKDFRQYNVSLQHQDKVDEVCVVESWIVADSYKDKANALGFNVPEGTWMVAMKVNNVDTWNRIKEGELKGFSVESLVSLEEFNKVENNETMEVENETFWAKLKKVINEALGKEVEKEEEVNEVEPTNVELEEEKPTETPVEEPKAEEPTEVKEEPKEEPKEAENKPTEVKEEPKEEPKKEDNHLEELINNLKAEIEALKEVNSGLQNKIKDLGKQPSTKPVSTTAKPNPKDTYSAWREQMRQYIS